MLSLSLSCVGLDTPYTAEKTIFGGKFNFSAFPEESDTDYTDSERGEPFPFVKTPPIHPFITNTTLKLITR